VELRIRHLSGSKSGNEEVFDADAIRIGREPSNDVAFDPYKDKVVSGRHAEISHDGSKWIVRDLGSSNGTYVGDERISIRALHSGDHVQLGRGGPKIEIRFTEESIPMTMVEGFDEPMRTVVMDRDMPGAPADSFDPAEKVTLRQGTIARLFTISTPSGPRVRVTPVALTIAAVIIAILGITAGRLTRKPEAAAKSAASADVEKLRKELAAREAQLKALDAKVNAALSDTSGVVSQDLDRQVRSEQVLIETLRSQLQSKNDQLAAEKSKAVNLAATKTVTPIQTVTDTAATDTAPPAELPPDNSYVRTKALRKRVNIVAEPAADGVPAALGGDFARVVGDVLATTGDFTIDRSGPFAVRVGVAHFAVENSATPPKSVMSKVRDTFRNRNDHPASQNIEMSAAVSVNDPAGKQIASAKPTYAVTGVPAMIDPAKVVLSDVLSADRPEGDVVRFVVANAADEAIKALDTAEPEIYVRSARKDIIALDAGKNLGIAPDDVFEVLDGDRVIARARIESVQDTLAIAYLTPPNVNVVNHKVRYVGVKKTEGAAAAGSATLKQQVDAYEGPGTSFKTAGSVTAGSRVRVIYTVGTWTRIEKGGQSVWVPASAVDASS
jgi:pSer/pThr/pTyr-binding forkhead associated (FHA) protein